MSARLMLVPTPITRATQVARAVLVGLARADRVVLVGLARVDRVVLVDLVRVDRVVLVDLVRADRVVLVGFLVDKAANLADRLLTTFAPALFVPGFSFDENRFTYRLKYLAI